MRRDQLGGSIRRGEREMVELREFLRAAGEIGLGVERDRVGMGWLSVSILCWMGRVLALIQ